MSFFKIVSKTFARFSAGGGGSDPVLSAYREGDYQLALKKCESLGKNSQRHFHFKGMLLYKVGRLEDSERLLRQGLVGCTDKKELSLIQEALGTTLVDLGRLDEAIVSFEQSLRQGPERSARHRAVAAAWLAAGGAPAKALSNAQVAARIAYSDSVADPDPEKMDLCEAVSTLAWAVAVNAKDEWEIGKLDRETSALCNEKDKPASALMHYCMGRAYSELGKTKPSNEHFAKAAAAEPQGNFGRLAKTALEEIGS